MKAWRKAAAGRTAKTKCLETIKAWPWWAERIKDLAKTEGWIFAWSVCQFHHLDKRRKPSQEELDDYKRWL